MAALIFSRKFTQLQLNSGILTKTKRERDWKQGGIPAGWRFFANWRKIQPPRPLLEGHGLPWATPKQPQLFGPAARRGQLKFGRGPGCPFQRAALGRSPQAAKFLPAAVAAGVDGRMTGRRLALSSNRRRGKAPDPGAAAPPPAGPRN